MNSLTANDLKLGGVKALEQAISGSSEVAITVRGEKKFIVITADMYEYYRQCDLEKALKDSKEDIKNGDFVVESAEDHIRRLKKEVHG